METANPAGGTRPLPSLIEWLAKHGIAYSLHEHATTYTARETARVEHINPQTFAKAVGVTWGGRGALIVIQASDHVDLVRARREIEAPQLRLMTEQELAEACPGCDVGATPPVGELFGLPTYADVSLTQDQEITFHAGSHGWAVRADRAAWERALQPVYADLAEHRDIEPAWMRS